MLISAGENIAGYKISEYKDVVFGACNSSQSAGYRLIAVKKAAEAASKLGANALINLDIKIYSISEGVQEATAYGNAVIADPIEGQTPVADKPKVKLEAYLPKAQSNIPTTSVQVVGDYKFVSCPKCGTKYKADTNEAGEICIKGFDDVDDTEPGLQVYCLRCGTKFTVSQ